MSFLTLRVLEQVADDYFGSEPDQRAQGRTRNR
jgi:hypothetical protein